MKSVIGAVALSSLVLASPASAEIIDERPSMQGEHSSGFLFRGTFGLGYDALSLSSEGGFDATISGLGASLGIALGGFVTPGLAINADLYGSTILNPSAEVDGFGETGDVDATITFAALGLGVTYYVMPLNLYIAGSLGIGQLQLEQNGETAETDFGFTFHATLGKEWFVSQNWGVGVALDFNWADVPTDGDGDSASYTTIAIAFSATYN